MRKDPPVIPIGDVYLHVSNSGAKFIIEDHRGPTIRIVTSSFGNLNQETKIMTTVEGLQKLRDLFDLALKHQFSEPYIIPAYPPDYSKRHDDDDCKEETEDEQEKTA